VEKEKTLDVRTRVALWSFLLCFIVEPEKKNPGKREEEIGKEKILTSRQFPSGFFRLADEKDSKPTERRSEALRTNAVQTTPSVSLSSLLLSSTSLVWTYSLLNASLHFL